MQAFRVQPAGPVTAYKTYGMSMPLSSHWRKATCAEVGCTHWQNGWVTICDVSDEDSKSRADYIMRECGRAYTVARTGLTTFEFTFPPGQPCFTYGQHRLPVDRQPVLYVRPGDWRGKTGETRYHSRTEDWVDDSETHLDQLRTRLARG